MRRAPCALLDALEILRRCLSIIIANMPRLDEWAVRTIAEAGRETQRRQSASPDADARWMHRTTEVHHRTHLTTEAALLRARRTSGGTVRRREEGAATRRDEQEYKAGRRCAARALFSRVGRGEGGGDAALRRGDGGEFSPLLLFFSLLFPLFLFGSPLDPPSAGNFSH